MSTYNDDGEVLESYILSHEEGRYGVDIPENVWHGLECLEPSVLLECKSCARVCPMQLTPYDSRGEAVGYLHPDCLKCGKCVKACPTNVAELRS